MSTFFEKLKKRWEIQHNWELVIILLVFALTGTSTIYLYDFIKNWIGITPETFFATKIIAFTFLALPLYNILLILWGKVLGKGIFFQRFAKQFLGKIFPFLQKK